MYIATLYIGSLWTFEWGLIVHYQRLCYFIFNKCTFPFLVVDFPGSLLIRLQTPRSMYHQHYSPMFPVFSYFVLSIGQLHVCEGSGACASHPALNFWKQAVI